MLEFYFPSLNTAKTKKSHFITYILELTIFISYVSKYPRIISSVLEAGK
jgi:hypothetical protein